MSREGFGAAAWQHAADVLLALRRERESLDLREAEAVAASRLAGLRWCDVAYALGVPESTVYYRYGDRPQRKSRRAGGRVPAPRVASA